MSKRGLQVAIQFGQRLPSFAGLAQAREYYFAYRDNHLALLASAAGKQTGFTCDYSPESLKQLEQWYFELYETDSFQVYDLDRERFERCMSMYFGEVAVRNTRGAKWVVQEYVTGHGKYELGVSKGLMTVMLNRFKDHFEEPNNKRKQSIYRRYKKYFD
jgi:hypothetical protein